MEIAHNQIKPSKAFPYIGPWVRMMEEELLRALAEGFKHQTVRMSLHCVKTSSGTTQDKSFASLLMCCLQVIYKVELRMAGTEPVSC